MFKRVLWLVVLVCFSVTAYVDVQAQNEPMIVKRCESSGRCEFVVQFPEATIFAGALWSINGVQRTPVLVEANKAFVHYFNLPGDYQITALVFFYDAAPVKVSTTFTVLPLGNPIERAIETAKNFTVNYVLPFITAVVLLMNALGVRLV